MSCVARGGALSEAGGAAPAAPRNPNFRFFRFRVWRRCRHERRGVVPWSARFGRDRALSFCSLFPWGGLGPVGGAHQIGGARSRIRTRNEPKPSQGEVPGGLKTTPDAQFGTPTTPCPCGARWPEVAFLFPVLAPTGRFKRHPLPMGQWSMAPTHPRTCRAALVVVGLCPTKGGCAGARHLLRRVSWLTFDAVLAFGAGRGRVKKE